MSADFQGIQGGSGDVYAGPYTWGSDKPRRIADIHAAHEPPGTFRARDDYDGAWLDVVAGEMVPLTPELRAKKDAKLVASRADLRALRAVALSLIKDIDALLT